MNPYVKHTDIIPEARRALLGEDENFEEYIAFAEGVIPQDSNLKKLDDLDLKQAIIKGLKTEAADLTKKALVAEKPLDIVNKEIIPALDIVGEGYENKKIYLPGLLMSAEAAGAAFECIKAAMPSGESATRCRVVLATVKGDIHDIGKNIVKLILENYGFSVTDLGKDVPAERIAEEVLRLNAEVLGLSALMTTTLPAMAESVRLVKDKAPSCKIMVGGAVLTEEYAKQIGADFYGMDALSAVKFVESVNKT
jgi:5-methyltetrahydrofolate--homocysteine methyltransferase